MYKIFKIFIVLLFLVLFSISLSAKDEGRELNLDKIADDFKFQNGVQFIKLNRFDKAIEALNEYLEIFYQGNHRNEAYKYIAKIYLERFEYQKAQSIFRTIYEEFSDTDDGVDAYYNIGLCFKKMGNDDEAQSIFKEIIKNYSDSIYVHQARIQLDLLNILND